MKVHHLARCADRSVMSPAAGTSAAITETSGDSLTVEIILFENGKFEGPRSKEGVRSERSAASQNRHRPMWCLNKQTNARARIVGRLFKRSSIVSGTSLSRNDKSRSQGTGFREMKNSRYEDYSSAPSSPMASTGHPSIASSQSASSSSLSGCLKT